MICLSPKPSSEKKKPLYIVCSVRRLNKILGGHPGISSHHFGEHQLSCQLFTRKEASWGKILTTSLFQLHFRTYKQIYLYYKLRIELQSDHYLKFTRSAINPLKQVVSSVSAWLVTLRTLDATLPMLITLMLLLLLLLYLDFDTKKAKVDFYAICRFGWFLGFSVGPPIETRTLSPLNSDEINLQSRFTLTLVVQILFLIFSQSVDNIVSKTT